MSLFGLRLWDAIVVGAGGAHGSAALYHLAKQGVRVLGLEAQPSAPHDLGSSHGLSRIIRQSYFEDPSYVPLCQESYRMWQALEAATGQELLTETGCINVARGARPDGEWNCFHGARVSAISHGLQFRAYSAKEASTRFPAFHIPKGFRALWEPAAGMLAPERCIAAHLHTATHHHDAQLMCAAKVLSWRVLAPGGAAPAPLPLAAGSRWREEEWWGRAEEAPAGAVAVTTTQGTFLARRLILAGGAWMPQLVPELKPLLSVERQVVAWFQVDPAQQHNFSPAAFPVFLLQDSEAYFYGFPADQHGFKLGKFNHLHEVTTADEVNRSVTAADEAALRRGVQRYFPAADGPITRTAVCLFTNTPDSNFILDRHPRWPQVLLCSACSGHGFKFAPVIGSVLADLALSPHGNTRHDIELHRLRPNRPGQATVLDALKGPA